MMRTAPATREQIKLRLLIHLLDLALAAADGKDDEVEACMEKVVDEFERVAGSPAH